MGDVNFSAEDARKLLDRYEIKEFPAGGVRISYAMEPERAVPGRWAQDAFGLWVPREHADANALVSLDDRVTFTVRQQWGMEVRQDGCRLFDQELGTWRDADWKESARIRQTFIEAFGPEISRMAGIEPE